jgi:hypothetical protein
MAFLHASLLAGLLLAAIPVLLHLLWRRQPVPIVFPTLRFVQQTAQRAQRGWNIKHALLLALRVLLMALAAVALAGPRVHSQMLASWLWLGLLALLAALATVIALVAWATQRPPAVVGGSAIAAGGMWLGWLVACGFALGLGPAPPSMRSNEPVAAVLVVDTSPTMAYLHQGLSRLQAAQELGGWLLERLPDGSQAAILSGEQFGLLGGDLASAARQLRRLEVEDRITPLPLRLRQALELVAASELQRREVYVLSDLTVPGWQGAAEAGLREQLEAGPNTLLQLIDVGLEPVRNWRLEQVSLSQQVVAAGGSVVVSATARVDADQPPPGLAVELWREPLDPTLPVLRDGRLITASAELVERRQLEIGPGETGSVDFTLSGLPAGAHHLQLRLTPDDALPVDNVRYLTVVAREPGRLAIVSADQELGEVLAAVAQPEPSDSGGRDSALQSGANRAEGVAATASEPAVIEPGSAVLDSAESAAGAELIDYPRLATLSDGYRGVVLHDPENLTAEADARLQRLVAGGGTLVILLGPSAAPAERLRDTLLASWLPGEPARISRRPRGDRQVFLNPVQLRHPIFLEFGSILPEVPWNAFPVYRHWDLDPLERSASVLVNYSFSGQPALVEQVRGSGRVLTLTTPLPEPARPEGRPAWNELTSRVDAWPSFGLLLGLFRYAAGWDDFQTNYQVDEPVRLRLPETLLSEEPWRLDLFTPAGELVRLEGSEPNLIQSGSRRAGTYRVRGPEGVAGTTLGWSSHVAPEATLLQRTEAAQWDTWLGPANYRLARDRDSVDSSVGQARYGQPLFPYLWLLVLLLLVGEQAMASRFYALKWGQGR